MLLRSVILSIGIILVSSCNRYGNQAPPADAQPEQRAAVGADMQAMQKNIMDGIKAQGAATASVMKVQALNQERMEKIERRLATIEARLKIDSPKE